ncbi:hypothetical protein ABT124_49725 [Streptomyces sp. NPDC001982]|uniref:hypothetical protein n=1 Tax=Streptomyces sp. NPDC001982 TaxID=3154405 RepID=UPI00331CC7E5
MALAGAVPGPAADAVHQSVVVEREPDGRGRCAAGQVNARRGLRAQGRGVRGGLAAAARREGGRRPLPSVLMQW